MDASDDSPSVADECRDTPPYARAAAQFSELTHVNLSKSSLQELVKTYGGRLVERQAEEAQATVQIPRTETEVVWREVVEPASEVMNISMDGAMVNIRGEGWKELKLVTVSAVRHLIDAVTGNLTTHLDEHSYRAGLWDATEFCQQQWAEACGRGLEKANYLSSVNDGAAWIWNIVRMCYGNCVEILDWWHAVEKLWLIAQHHFDAESEQPTEWVSAQKQLLIEGSLSAILRNVRLLYPQRHSLPLTPCARRFSISSTIAGVCATTYSVRRVTPSAAAPSSPPANMSSNSVSNNLACVGRVWAPKPCSRCAQLSSVSPTTTHLNSLPLPDGQ